MVELAKQRLIMLAVFAACVIGALYALIVLFWEVLVWGRSDRAWQVAVALDQSVNAASGGWADESLSSRAYRESGTSFKWWSIMWVINVISADEAHCAKAWEAERTRAQLPPELRA